MTRIGLWLLISFLLVAASVLEVAGDALIRSGLRGRGVGWVVVGAATLAAYGIVVNLVPWDFARLLGTYVAVFAVVAVLVGRFWFGDVVSPTTWIGLACIVAGGALIQVGSR